MEFTASEWETIERACRSQAYSYRQLAEATDRPIMRNQRLDLAERLMAIAAQIEEDRRRQAAESRTPTND